MPYLLDTVALVRHLTDNKNIGRKAFRLLETVELERDTLAVSVISLMEILYLGEKRRINIDLGQTLDRLNSSSLYAIVDLTADIIAVAQRIDFFELHDRLILATAKWMQIPILSSDMQMKSVSGIEVIWD